MRLLVSSSILKEVGFRLVVSVALLAAYYYLWRPLRALFVESLAFPILSWFYTDTHVILQMGGDPLVLRAIGELGNAHLRAPAGITFLLPALVLVALFPRKPYWFYFLGLHLVIGLFEWTLLLIGMHSWHGGFHLADFLVEYVVPAIGIGIPLLLLTEKKGVFDSKPAYQDSIEPVG